MTDFNFVKKALMVAAGATALALVGSVHEAKALTLITDPVDTNLVTGIEDLDIGGSLFDVDFVVDSFDNIFTNTGLTPTFFGDISGAETAANAIILALGDTFATAVTPDSSLDTDDFVVPYDLLGFGVPVWTDFSGDLLDVDEAGQNVVQPSQLLVQSPIAVFTPVEPEPVPEPFTILGSLSALGLGAALKKKQQKKG